MSGAGRNRAALLAILGLLAGALVALQFDGAEPGLLYLAPALALLAALVFDRYPGERLLEALARAWHPRASRQSRSPARRVPPRSFPRGGALLAMALAGRGPPA
jgi:hypothetical protein